jgi:hypothetical protein
VQPAVGVHGVKQRAVCRAGREAFGGTSERQLHCDHGAEARFVSVATSVSADTPPPWQKLSSVPILAVPAGGCAVSAGEPATHLVVLLSGAVNACIDTAARRVVAVGSWTAPVALDTVASRGSLSTGRCEALSRMI